MDLTIDNIRKFIDERKKVYANPDNAVPAYHSEIEISKEYNGRQILEFIQNADDASASEMRISVDTDAHILSVYNNGEPITYEGIKSIMIPHYSSKVSSSYIGNKGLGFRSVLVWADKVVIKTRGIAVSFSSEIARNTACSIGLDLPRIRKERNLSENCCPFPVLAVAEVEETAFEEGCTFLISYKEEFQENIIEQIQAIDEKTLLFLNHIRRIVVDDNTELSITQSENGNYVADGQEWRVIAEDGVLPEHLQDKTKEEKKKYGVKLAFPLVSASSQYRLYNYLPTKEEVCLPYLVHATLELDSSRNHVNESKANEYVITKIANAISHYIDGIIDNTEPSWALYNLMTPSEEISHSYFTTILYDKLKAERDRKCIFPTVGSGYVNMDEYYYSDDNDSDFWLRFPFRTEVFSRVLLPLQPISNACDIRKKDIDSGIFVDAINAISCNPYMPIPDRASLLFYLIQANIPRGDYHLLVNGNGVIIGDEYKTFTPKTLNSDYQLPSFVRIDFLNNDLYNHLYGLLQRGGYESRYNTDDKINKARIFARILNDRNVASISSYDKDQVLLSVVSQTNKFINNAVESEEKSSAIKEMMKCLYHVYSYSGFDTELRDVQLLNDKGEMMGATALLLRTECNVSVFGDTVDYVMPADAWGLEDVEEGVFNELVCRLGVNKLTDEGYIFDNKLRHYGDWLENNKEYKEARHNTRDLLKANHSVKFTRLSDLLMQHVQNLSANKIITLLAGNDALYSHVLNPSVTLTFRYGPSNTHLTTGYSYLKYQIQMLPSIRNKIISRDIRVDTYSAEPIAKTVPTERVEMVMEFLSTNIRSMSESVIANILNSVAYNGFPKRNIRRLYKHVITALSMDGRTLKGEDFKLYSDDGHFYPAREVYYTDNNSIPDNIIKSLGKKRLYYGSRQGEDKVCVSLGLEKLREFSPMVRKDDVAVHHLDNEFRMLLESCKPYILLYVLQNIDSMDMKKDMASRLKNMNVILVNNCRYTIQNKPDTMVLYPAEFIQSSGVFYLNVYGIDSVEDIKDSVEYCNSIAEILSIVTKVDGKNDVNIRIIQNLDFMSKSAKKDFPDADIEEVFDLLGGFAEGNPETQKSPDKVDIAVLHNIKFDEAKSRFRQKFIHSLWLFLCKEKSRQSQFIQYQRDYENMRMAESADELLSDEEYGTMLKENIRQCFGFSVSEDAEPIKHTNLYPEYDDAINELQISEQSLFYFEGNDDVVRQLCTGLSDDNADHTEPTSSENNRQEPIDFSVIESVKIIKGILGQPTHTPQGGNRVHNRKTERQKTLAGKKAELLVRDALRQRGYVYSWKSGYSDESNKDDTIGYDFEYMDNGEQRYLEVKNFSSGQFIISQHEYDVAHDEKHKGKYDIALVCDGKISLIRDFFSGEYAKRANGYVISCRFDAE